MSKSGVRLFAKTRGIEMLLGGLARRSANRRKPLWAQLIFALDRWLRRRQGVFEYNHKPDCIFRVQLGRLYSEVMLSDGTFGRPGDRVIDLHFWNEQIPITPVAGHSLAWGCRFNRSFAESLRGLARFLMSEPELSDINIIRANINLDPLHRIAARHGFEAIRDPVRLSPWEHVHRFGENILCWLLTLACNSGRARPNKLWRSRQVIYLSRRVLHCKHIAATRGHLTPVRHEDAGTIPHQVDSQPNGSTKHGSE
jgi:YkoP domain